MELREKTLELKNKVITGLHKWMDERIEQFMMDNPMLAPTGKYLKRGISNMIIREDERIGKGINNLMLFIADENGNYDMDMLIDDALLMFKSMPESDFDMGILHGTIGKGVICVMLPDNPLVSLFMGNTGAIKITGEDFKKLKEILCTEIDT